MNQAPAAAPSDVNETPPDRDAPERGEQGQGGQQEAPEQWWGNPTIVQTIATVVIAIATLVILGVYIGQWNTMSRQAQYMRDGLAETRRSADAATAALKHTQEPLVLFDGLRKPSTLAPDGVLTAVLKNYGHGAARNVNIAVAVTLGKQRIHNKTGSTPITIGASGVAQMATDPINTFMSPEQIEHATSGATPLHLAIVVDYFGTGDKVIRRVFVANYQYATKEFTRMEVSEDAVANLLAKLDEAQKRQQ